MKQPEAAVSAFRNAQELRPDIRSYQGVTFKQKISYSIRQLSMLHSLHYWYFAFINAM